MNLLLSSARYRDSVMLPIFSSQFFAWWRSAPCSVSGHRVVITTHRGICTWGRGDDGIWWKRLLLTARVLPSWSCGTLGCLDVPRLCQTSDRLSCDRRHVWLAPYSSRYICQRIVVCTKTLQPGSIACLLPLEAPPFESVVFSIISLSIQDLGWWDVWKIW
jgi:hypothetical protein